MKVEVESFFLVRSKKFRIKRERFGGWNSAVIMRKKRKKERVVIIFEARKEDDEEEEEDYCIWSKATHPAA